MKKGFFIIVLFLSMACNTSKKKIVELSCGQCQFGLTTQEGCDLAIRIDDTSYFVDGVDIDDFGDAHDKSTGFCEVVRTAEVIGVLVDGRYQVSSVNLLD